MHPWYASLASYIIEDPADIMVVSGPPFPSRRLPRRRLRADQGSSRVLMTMLTTCLLGTIARALESTAWIRATAQECEKGTYHRKFGDWRIRNRGRRHEDHGRIRRVSSNR